MYFGDIWDWNFFWSVFKNFLSSLAPFLEIIIAGIAIAWVLKALISSVKGMSKS